MEQMEQHHIFQYAFVPHTYSRFIRSEKIRKKENRNSLTELKIKILFEIEIR